MKRLMCLYSAESTFDLRERCSFSARRNSSSLLAFSNVKGMRCCVVTAPAVSTADSVGTVTTSRSISVACGILVSSLGTGSAAAAAIAFNHSNVSECLASKRDFVVTADAVELFKRVLGASKVRVGAAVLLSSCAAVALVLKREKRVRES